MKQNLATWRKVHSSVTGNRKQDPPVAADEEEGEKYALPANEPEDDRPPHENDSWTQRETAFINAKTTSQAPARPAISENMGWPGGRQRSGYRDVYDYTMAQISQSRRINKTR